MEGSGQWGHEHEAWKSQFRKSGSSLGKQQSGAGKHVKWPRAEAVSLRNGGGGGGGMGVRTGTVSLRNWG